MRYDPASDNRLVPMPGTCTTRRVRTVPGGTVQGGLAPWLQDYAVTDWHSPWTDAVLYRESGFGHPWRAR